LSVASANLPDRGNIDELIAQYLFEPTTRDIWVEGLTDKDFFEWYLQARGIVGASILPIDSIEIDISDVLARGYEDGCKGRAMALAEVLEEKLATDAAKPIFVVDADADYLLGVVCSNKLVLKTDYCDLQLYSFNDVTLNKFLKLVIRSFPLTGNQVIDIVQPILIKLFLFRVANNILRWGLKPVPYLNACRLRDGAIVFNWEKHTVDYLRTKNRLKDRVIFESQVSSLESKRLADARKMINGHDLTWLLTWFIRSVKKKSTTPGFDQTDGPLMSCIEAVNLSSEALFSNLEARLGAKSRTRPLQRK
jgi:hypothetical protein